MSKSACSLTKVEFMGNAKGMPVQVGGQTIYAMPKEFSTGSFGWFLTGKIALEVNGKTVMVQCGMNLAVIGSKDAPMGGPCLPNSAIISQPKTLTAKPPAPSMAVLDGPAKAVSAPTPALSGAAQDLPRAAKR